MKLGVFNPMFGGMPLEEMLDRLVALGLEAVEMRTGPNSVDEIKAGHYPGQNQCDPAVLLADAGQRRRFQAAFAQRGLIISGLSCHGNPVHPDTQVATLFHRVFEDNVRLAAELGVGVVIVFSGCPGGAPGDQQPNWVTCTWPPEFKTILQWQWDEVVIPYWQKAGQFAQEHGVKIAIEMHPGFVVYNTATLLRLRQAVGPVIGANFDPSHLFWQQADPVAAIHALQGAIYHFHAKDTAINVYNTAVNGVLDTGSYRNPGERAWIFRTVGYGHDLLTWKNIVSALRLAGYDYVMSIEHEDALASRDEGLRKAVAFLKECLLSEPPVQAWWD
jgi:sugar phosphate isomerase/epimerase